MPEGKDKWASGDAEETGDRREGEEKALNFSSPTGTSDLCSTPQGSPFLPTCITRQLASPHLRAQLKEKLFCLGEGACTASSFLGISFLSLIPILSFLEKSNRILP